MDKDHVVEPFALSIEQNVLDDLQERLTRTRWPEDAPAPSWQQGVPLQELQRLRDYWMNRYDWRRCERMLNRIGQYRTAMDGLAIHFLHARSPEPGALPIVLTHGWPGSIVEFLKVIGPLTNPRGHGGRAADAFDVVVPSLPGFGFSDKPQTAGWTVQRIARAWIELMRRLGYQRYVAQGGDWGAAVAVEMAVARPRELLGIHLNMPIVFPDPKERVDLTDSEKAALDSMKHHFIHGRGYSEQQRTKPQTLGYGLADSPMGQAAWIYDKFRDWSDCDGDPRNSYSLDELLDNIMLYWLPNTGASAGRIYATPPPDEWERNDSLGFPPLSLPVGISIFPKELYRTSRRWAEGRFSRLIHFNELPRGGHFAAFEQPDSFVSELRSCFSLLRERT